MVTVRQLLLKERLFFSTLPSRLGRTMAVTSGELLTTAGVQHRVPSQTLRRRFHAFGRSCIVLGLLLSCTVLVADTKMSAWLRGQHTASPHHSISSPVLGSSRRTFICTARSQNSRLVLPEDGLCDVIFYDAACREYGVDFRKFGTSDETKPFIAAAASSVKTRYGLGMCGQDPNIYLDWLPSYTKFLSKSKSKIHHFAYLHIIDRLGYDGDLFRLIFTVLKNLLTAEISGFPVKRYGAIGVYVEKEEFILELIHLMKNVYTPDAVIVYGHLTDNREMPVISKHCIFLPPNGYYRPDHVYYDANYGHTLLNATSLAQRFWDSGVRIPYSLALTMGATKVVVKYPDNRNPNLGRYAIYQPCHYNKTIGASTRDFEDPKTYCNNASVSQVTPNNLQYQESAETWVTFDKEKHKEFAVAFDVAETIRFKVCHMALSHPPLKLSVTAADVNLDAGTSLCPKWESGPMDRVKMLKSLQRFLGSNAANPAFLELCMGLQA